MSREAAAWSSGDSYGAGSTGRNPATADSGLKAPRRSSDAQASRAPRHLVNPTATGGIQPTLDIALAILGLAAAYALFGALVGGAFVIAGVSVVDPAAAGRGAPWSFRLMILPGAAVLWPIVLVKWVRAARPHRQEHP